jgi:hypothetical protein
MRFNRAGPRRRTMRRSKRNLSDRANATGCPQSDDASHRVALSQQQVKRGDQASGQKDETGSQDRQGRTG